DEDRVGERAQQEQVHHEPGALGHLAVDDRDQDGEEQPDDAGSVAQDPSAARTGGCARCGPLSLQGRHAPALIGLLSAFCGFQRSVVVSVVCRDPCRLSCRPPRARASTVRTSSSMAPTVITEPTVGAAGSPRPLPTPIRTSSPTCSTTSGAHKIGLYGSRIPSTAGKMTATWAMIIETANPRKTA